MKEEHNHLRREEVHSHLKAIGEWSILPQEWDYRKS